MLCQRSPGTAFKCQSWKWNTHSDTFPNVSSSNSKWSKFGYIFNTSLLILRILFLGNNVTILHQNVTCLEKRNKALKRRGDVFSFFSFFSPLLLFCLNQDLWGRNGDCKKGLHSLSTTWYQGDFERIDTERGEHSIWGRATDTPICVLKVFLLAFPFKNKQKQWTPSIYSALMCLALC